MTPEYVILSDTALEVSDTAVGLPPSKRATAAMVTVGDVAVRFRVAGVPTPTSGHRAPAGSIIEVYGAEVAKLRLISEGAASSCFVSFLKNG